MNRQLLLTLLFASLCFSYSVAGGCSTFYQYTLGACPDVHFFGVSTATGTPSDWDWEFGDGGTSDIQNPVHTYTSNGDYIVCLTATGADGCIDQYCDTITINCIPPPCQAAFQFTLGLCPEILFFGNVNTGANVTTWFWDFGDGHTANTQAPSHTYTTNGQYTACLTITTNTGCSSTFCRQVPISCITTPCDVSFDVVSANCPAIQFSGHLNSTPETGAQWSWDFGDGGTANTQNTIHTYSANGDYVVCVSVTRSDGCTDEYCDTVSVNCIPPSCQGFYQYTLGLCPEVFFFGTANTAAGAVVNWIWSFGDGHIGNTQNPSHTYASNGDYIVCLLITTVNGCVDQYCDTVRVRCIPPPCEAFYQYTLGLCPETLFFGTSNTPSANIVDWSWNFGDGHNGNSQNPSHTYTSNGDYLVCLTITTAAGCVDEYCDTVRVHCIPPPCEAFYQYTLGLCPEVFFFGTAITAAGGIVDWNWNFGDGHTGNSQNPSHTYTSNGDYLVCLTITTAAGCVDEYCDTVRIHCVPPPCHAFYQYTLGLCPEVHFFGNSSTPSGTILDWDWDFGDGGTSDTQNPSHTYTANGSYIVCLTVTTANGCENEYCDTIVVDCIPPPCHAFYQYTLGLCPEVLFFGTANTAAGNIIDWSWNFGDGHNGNSQNPSHTYTSNGDYLVCLTITTAAGCVDEYCDTLRIRCIPEPCEAAFDYNEGQCPEIRFMGLSNENPGSIIHWAWDFGDGHTSNIPNPIHTYTSNGSYIVCLTITTADGCTNEFCDTVDINCIITSTFDQHYDQIILFPNPTHSNVHLMNHSSSPITDIRLYEINGKEIQRFENTTSHLNEIELEFLPKGIYLLSVNNEQVNYVYKIIKQ